MAARPAQRAAWAKALLALRSFPFPGYVLIDSRYRELPLLTIDGRDETILEDPEVQNSTCDLRLFLPRSSDPLKRYGILIGVLHTHIKGRVLVTYLVHPGNALMHYGVSG